jgi:hypothetical protein
MTVAPGTPSSGPSGHLLRAGKKGTIDDAADFLNKQDCRQPSCRQLGKCLIGLTTVSIVSFSTAIPVARAEASYSDTRGVYGSLKVGARALATRSSFCTFRGSYYLRGDQAIAASVATAPADSVAVVRNQKGATAFIFLNKDVSNSRGAVAEISSYLVTGFQECSEIEGLIDVTSWTVEGLEVVTGKGGTAVDFKYSPPSTKH